VSLLILIKGISVLFFIILLIYFCFLLTRKKIGLQLKKGKHKIHVLEHKHIGQKVTVSLISVDNYQLIMASHPNAITLEFMPILEKDVCNSSSKDSNFK
jgi:flagellar biogenesis protein FliO